MARWTPPQVCAVCEYDIANLDFTRTTLCPECGQPISVRIVPPVRPYQDFAAAVGFLTSVLWVGAALLNVPYWSASPAEVWGKFLGIGLMVAVSMAGIRILATRNGPPKLRTAAVIMALAPVLVPIVLVLAAAVLG